MAPVLLRNGVALDSGQPLADWSVAQALAQALAEQTGTATDPARAALAQRQRSLYEARLENLGVLGEYEPLDPLDSGWGVVFAPGTPQAVRTALQPLVDRRQGRVYNYAGETDAYVFRAAHGQPPGLVDPKKLPYYLLLVGSPEEISFDFQYDLDGQHAVGRLYFPEVGGYQAYVQRLIAYETQAAVAQRLGLGLFAPEVDAATRHSAQHLAGFLADDLASNKLKLDREQGQGAQQVQAAVRKVGGPAANLAGLLDVLGGDEALVLTATHGVFAPAGDPRQPSQQGALLCHPWTPGSPVGPGMALSAAALPAGLALDGKFLVLFACNSAGTPVENPYEPGGAPVANAPFVAALAQQMLRQGALGVFGHVDVAWSYSYLDAAQPDGQSAPNSNTFLELVRGLLRGLPAGHALEPFNLRYLELNNRLTGNGGLLAQYKGLKPVDDSLATIWLARTDARSTILLGDPAARLRADMLIR